jgi:hypothetical protein
MSGGGVMRASFGRWSRASELVASACTCHSASRLAPVCNAVLRAITAALSSASAGSSALPAAAPPPFKSQQPPSYTTLATNLRAMLHLRFR